MTDFISTSGGKIVNVNAIAFLTSRTKEAPGGLGKGDITQLVIGFSAAGVISDGGLMPLSLVMQGDEAREFLGHLDQRGIDVKPLLHKIS